MSTLKQRVEQIVRAHFFNCSADSPLFDLLKREFLEMPVQDDGKDGCICRTCGQDHAVYLDQCTACRQKSTVDDDREFLR